MACCLVGYLVSNSDTDNAEYGKNATKIKAILVHEQQVGISKKWSRINTGRIKTQPLTTETLINALLTKNETSGLINIIKLMNTSL